MMVKGLVSNEKVNVLAGASIPVRSDSQGSNECVRHASSVEGFVSCFHGAKNFVRNDSVEVANVRVPMRHGTSPERELNSHTRAL
jgi:hypothetical protein